ncbi:hypothetical protein ACK1YF_004813 [Salmonella enterica]|nr:hypothetical protein [Salmonella enterica]EJF5922199.1 hypothetical protein [Salmonella enterica]EJF5944926.1 hypothetical protein [Salmonella enterica]EJW2053499.1 hypothetical protein [Salmonella enterica]EJW2206433.1 hypothetical protein [Salmonella enterica]
MDRKTEYLIHEIAAKQVKGHMAIVQLLIHQMLQNLEKKPGCENFTQEIVSSLEALREQMWTGKDVVTAAILTPKGTPADIRREGNLDGLEKPEGSSATLMLNVLLHNFQRRTSARASKV